MSTNVPPIRYGVIGMHHNHIFEMVMMLNAAGAEGVAYYPEEGDFSAPLSSFMQDATEATDPSQIYEDESIDVILGAGIPKDRAPVGIQAMRHGKDYVVDKPGLTTLDQLAEARKAHDETGRRFLVFYSERLVNKATVRAGELISDGAIGRVVHTNGLGPHRLGAGNRPDWFFKHDCYGGILCDIAAHQADQFLFFTGSTAASVVSSRVANYAHPEYPELEDFGEVSFAADHASGYARVDWYTPDGLPTWGDGRLTILGTEGYIEIRKEVDIAGREGKDHLFLVNSNEPQYVDCSDTKLPFAEQLACDIRDRTETCMTQAHSFLASELVLTAQANATVAKPGQ